MTRDTAVTEKIDYTTVECEICATEAATDPVPADVIDAQAFAVVLGEGEFESERERQGNWDVEHKFKLREKDDDLPQVEGHIICEHCAAEIHDVQLSSGAFTGSIPPEIDSNSITGTNNNNRRGDQESTRQIVFVIIALLVVFFFLIFLSL